MEAKIIRRKYHRTVVRIREAVSIEETVAEVVCDLGVCAVEIDAGCDSVRQC